MRPLDGVRVLELGQLVAGPFAGAILAEHGAEVIKVEPPEGDALRTWRAAPGETSLWWRSTGRNKRSVVVDLREPEGRTLAIQLAKKSDVLLEMPGASGREPRALRLWSRGRQFAERTSDAAPGTSGPAPSKAGECLRKTCCVSTPPWSSPG